MRPTTALSQFISSKCLSSERIARKLRVSRRTVEAWRCGARVPNEWSRLKLSTFLGISAAKLNAMLGAH